MSGVDATPTLGTMIRDAIAARLNGVHVSLPARVEAYDASARTCRAQPLVHERYVDEFGDVQVRPYPPVPRALVVWPHGYKAVLRAGDSVMLVFASTDLANYVAGTGSEVAPAGGRRHSLTDAFAFPFDRYDPSPLVELTATEVHAGGSAALALLSDLSTFMTVLNATRTALTGLGDPGANALTTLYNNLVTAGFPVGTVVTKGA